MPYEKQTWVDRQVQNPMTFVLTNNADGTVTLTPSPGAVTNEGSLLLAERLNHMEDGITLVNNKIDKELKPIKNCNDAIETGIYWAPAGTQNNPSNNNFIIQTFNRNVGNIMQVAYLALGGYDVTYKRYYSKSWSSWVSSVKSGISICFNSVSQLQAGHSRFYFNKVLNTTGSNLYATEGYVRTRKNMKVLVTFNVWVNTNARVWFSVYNLRNNVTINSIDLIGQDASGYQTLSGSAIFDLRVGDVIQVSNNQPDAVYLNRRFWKKSGNSIKCCRNIERR